MPRTVGGDIQVTTVIDGPPSLQAHYQNAGLWAVQGEYLIDGARVEVKRPMWSSRPVSHVSLQATAWD